MRGFNIQYDFAPILTWQSRRPNLVQTYCAQFTLWPQISVEVMVNISIYVATSLCNCKHCNVLYNPNYLLKWWSIIPFTECPKIYRKSVHHLPKYTTNLLQMQYRFAVNFWTLSKLRLHCTSVHTKMYCMTPIIC